jgi:hypothetical protein
MTDTAGGFQSSAGQSMSLAEAAEAAKAMLKDANGRGFRLIHSDPRRRPAAALTEGCAAG